MFRQRLSALLQEQRERMALIVSSDTVDEAFDFLEAHGLDANSVDQACTAELKNVLRRTNDVQMDMSSRLNKYGWSTARILEHMNNVFTAKMKTIGRVLKAFLDSTDASEALHGYDGPKNAQVSELSGPVAHEVSSAYEETYEAYEYDSVEANEANASGLLSSLEQLKNI